VNGVSQPQDVLSKALKLVADANRDGYYFNITPEDIVVLYYNEEDNCRRANIVTRHGVRIDIRLCGSDWLWVDVRPLHICDCTPP
jgi:hypothetical protein